MAATFRRLASAIPFTTTPSPADRSQLNGRSRSAPFSGHTEGEGGIGDARCLQLLTMFIDMQIKDFIAQTRTVQKFRSTKQSRDTESYYYFRLPIEAAVTSFKLEIGDNHAIEDETRPTKQARKLYDRAVHNKTPAAILKEVQPGIYQANLGRIPPDIQVTIVFKYAQRIASNARGELVINCPAVSPSIRSACSEDTKIALSIEIIQEDSVRTVSSPTHQKLLSIKAGVMGAAREVETFSSFQRRTPASSLEQPNQATVNLSGSHTVLDKDFELAITTSNETRETTASLSAINKFGHAVLTITIHPWDLFNGERDTEWSFDFELNHPWQCCSSDLSELNLTRIQYHGTNSSPSTYKFVQSPKMTPKISHLQSYSVFFLLDFKGSTEYSLDSVRINALPTSGSHPVRTMTLGVNRTHKADDILQKLCVNSILRDLYATMVSQDHLQLYSEGRSFGFSTLVTSAERLGQMYSVCNRWTSKVAVDSVCDSDDDIDFNGPRPYEDELSRLTLPTHMSPPDRPAMIGMPQHARLTQPSALEATKEASRKYIGGFDFDLGPNSSEGGRASPMRRVSVQKPRESWPCRKSGAVQSRLNRLNEYFVPRDGIDREVIAADITRYLGNDALVRPGTFENKEDGCAMQGYFITSYRNLTSEMIADLKADSARWEQERRNDNSGMSQHDARTGQDYASFRHETTGTSHYTTPATGAGPTSGARQGYSLAPYPASGMAVTRHPHPRDPTHGDESACSMPSNHQSYYSIGTKLGRDERQGPPERTSGPKRRQSILAGQQASGSQEFHEAQRIWPQIAASRSANGTYVLSADLRDRMAAHFNPGTREWLVARIAPSLPDENGWLGSDFVADTILVLAFVKTCMPLRYEEVEQGAGLILRSWQDQQEILEELVLRVRVEQW